MAAEEPALTKEQDRMARLLNVKPVARNLQLIDKALAIEWDVGPEAFQHKIAAMLRPPEQDDASELQRLYSGEAIVIPRNRDHAERMLMIAEHWLKNNPK